ncbi:hypothetical protein FOZ61_008223 [Perkinsus olseni]|uniref:Uncharacterized protein n=1 Tax=Perkinsus olseni TaxID=32597 RepID=A0A7J6L972_PEROL|nr:hypothetical protein FOL46_008122 [Perkinsus olseni]KAF4667510.1 hypothetical protein FOZ61_008223 [Perkinsus olseni]
MLPADTPQDGLSPPPPPPPLPIDARQEPPPATASEVRLGPTTAPPTGSPMERSDVKTIEPSDATAVAEPRADSGDQIIAQPRRVETERYEVTFALPGPLGMEFTEIEPPYRICRVHPGSIAERLDVKPGDCMRAVDGNALSEKVDWPSIRQMLSKRPVVAQFERGVPEDLEGSTIGGVVGNWGVGVLTSAISNVKTATHAAISTGIGSSKRAAVDDGRAPEDHGRVESLQAQVAELKRQLAERPVVEVRRPATEGQTAAGGDNDSFSTLADAYASLQQQHSSLLAQFDSMQQMQANADDVERYKGQVKQLEQEKKALEGAVTELGDLDTLKDRLRKGMEAEVNAAGQARQIATLQDQVDKLRNSLAASQEALDSYTAAIDNAEDLQLGDVSELQARLDDALADKARTQAALVAEEQKSRKFQEQGEKVLDLTRSLGSVTAERDTLRSRVGELEKVVNSCLQKLQNELQDRPYLIDRREVARAVTAFVQGCDAGDEESAVQRLTEQLGFTVEERKALGPALAEAEAPRPSLLKRAAGQEDKRERFGDSFLAFLEHEVGDDGQASDRKVPDPDDPESA